MDQMNVSITSQLASSVRSARTSSAVGFVSEVVREALRRMEDDDARVLRLAKPTAEDVLADLTEDQLDGIRQRVRASIESIGAGRFVEYEGRQGLRKLADRTKARGRKLLARKASGQ